ncbi:hypothetical protein EKO04_009753 [Ascochyta lentis]|uniref:Uncharacterized protein n=1 Tax=Ascochyta lentis TaxID=205686 RepID=A0A8H7ITD6_9PLEO|nr:hypothetical protein EKO04_009753 [Ascochyta lentis]
MMRTSSPGVDGSSRAPRASPSHYTAPAPSYARRSPCTCNHLLNHSPVLKIKDLRVQPQVLQPRSGRASSPHTAPSTLASGAIDRQSISNNNFGRSLDHFTIRPTPVFVLLDNDPSLPSLTANRNDHPNSIDRRNEPPGRRKEISTELCSAKTEQLRTDLEQHVKTTYPTSCDSTATDSLVTTYEDGNSNRAGYWCHDMTTQRQYVAALDLGTTHAPRSSSTGIRRLEPAQREVALHCKLSAELPKADHLHLDISRDSNMLVWNCLQRGARHLEGFVALDDRVHKGLQLSTTGEVAVYENSSQHYFESGTIAQDELVSKTVLDNVSLGQLGSRRLAARQARTPSTRDEGQTTPERTGDIQAQSQPATYSVMVCEDSDTVAHIEGRAGTTALYSVPRLRKRHLRLLPLHAREKLWARQEAQIYSLEISLCSGRIVFISAPHVSRHERP